MTDIVKIGNKQYVNIQDNDIYSYRPISDGISASSARVPALRRDGTIRGKIFQIGSDWSSYRTSKQLCYNVLPKDSYYAKSNAHVHQGREACKSIINSLTTEYPDLFKIYYHDGVATLACSLSKEDICFDPSDMSLVYDTSSIGYKDLLDALAFQVQEDIVVVSGGGGTAVASHIHLHSPNHWGANWAIGRSFEELHEEVKKRDGQLVVKRPNDVALTFCNNPVRLERVGAISFRTSGILNRHPDNHELTAALPDFDPANPQLYMRFERQTIQGLPETNCFLFTIRTYFYDIFAPGREEEMAKAFSNIHTDVYSRWFTDTHAQNVLDALHERKKCVYL